MRERHGHGSERLGLSPTYQSWKAMRRRCNTPAYSHYKYYGGRGITICERWNSFLNFLEDMGERLDGRTLDRYPNKDGNYKPSNCRWATKQQQMLNKKGVNQFPGVSFNTSRKVWKSTAPTINKVRRHLGWYPEKEDAIAARKQWEKENLT